MLDSEATQSRDAAKAQTLQSEEVSCSNPGSNSSQLAIRLRADRARHLQYLRSRLPSIEDAEDALQDTALKLISRADLFEATDNPDAWIGAALRNAVVDRYRRAAAQRRFSEDFLNEPLPCTEADEEEALVPIACLKATLPSLKTEYASLLVQVYLGGVSLNDIARDQHLTVNNVAVRLHRARNALRQKVQRQCMTCPLDDCLARQRPNTAATDSPIGHQG